MTKDRTKPANRGYDPNAIMVKGDPKAAVTINDFSKRPDTGVEGFRDALGEQVTVAQSNDLGRAEGMLTAQAHTLDAIFNNLARRSAGNFNAGYLPAGETYMRLALKAQSQCRTTLETLAEIKNPKAVAFVKQANIGENVQVNNASAANVSHERARENKKPPNELLELQHGARLDFGTPRTAVGADPHMGDRGKNRRARERQRVRLR